MRARTTVPMPYALSAGLKRGITGNSMSNLRIYGIARTRAFRALWIAKELGLDYEHIPIEIGRGRRTPAGLLAINPNGRLLRSTTTARPVGIRSRSRSSRQEARPVYPARSKCEPRPGMEPVVGAGGRPRVNICSLHAGAPAPRSRSAAPSPRRNKVVEGPFKVLDGALPAPRICSATTFTVADLTSLR